MSYLSTVDDLLNNPAILSLAHIKQHRTTNRLEHSKNVSYVVYALCKEFELRTEEATRAALLHDFCFRNYGLLQPYLHPVEAACNAYNLAHFNKFQCNIILSHMWPTSLVRPSSTEAFLVSFADKFCAVYEFAGIKDMTYPKNLIRQRILQNA